MSLLIIFVDNRDRAIERLLFLSGRIHEMRVNGQTDGATLVSSEAGHLRWWNVYGRLSELGQLTMLLLPAVIKLSIRQVCMIILLILGSFYVPVNANEIVLALNANTTSSELVTGDTGGWLAIWNIADYCRTAGGVSDITLLVPV